MTSLPFLQSPLFIRQNGIRHGFFTRLGGVSTEKFGSLNCSPYSEDLAENIVANRKRVSDTLECQQVISLKQVHSNKVCLVDDEWNVDAVREGDGLVTTKQNIAIGVLGADCAPVLFADIENGVVGAAHGGWKGAINGVTDGVVALMCQQGADLTRIVASIGPAIQRESYEVSADFQKQVFEQSAIECNDCFSSGLTDQTRWFDLPLYLEKKLQSVGLTKIHRMTEDTYSDEKQFFSYRRTCHRNETLYGRQIAAICLSID